MAVFSQPAKAIISAQQGKKMLETERTAEQKVGDKWYVVTHNWWLNFVQQVEEAKHDNDKIKMPPISNQSLVKEIPDANRKTKYELRSGLQPMIDIAVLPASVFNTLKNIYGIEDEERDTIERHVVLGTLMNQSPFIEIYPLEIKVADFHRRDEVHTVLVSHAESIDKIRNIIMDRLQIGEQDRKTAEFFIEENGQCEKLSDSISQMKLSALLSSGSTIFVEANPLSANATNNGTTRTGTRYNMYARTSSTYQRGICGLQNLGNTCFMNSALQCLSNVPELTDYFLTDEYLHEINEQNALGTQGRLVKAYAELLQEMWSGQASSVRPFKLKCTIGEYAPRFNGYAQQDSQELTAFLLDGLHEDLNRIKKKPYIEEKEVEGKNEAQAALEAWQDYRKRNDSIIVDLMHGQLKSTLHCNICNKVSIKFDPFCFLSVPIPAKERQMKSTITFVRKNKWAKFSITHTNKTTAKQIKPSLREHLKLTNESQQIVMLTYYNAEVVDDDQALGTPYNYHNKQFYAYTVDEPGPIVLVENKAAANHNLLGLTFPIKRPAKFTRQFINEEVLPRCREFFWQDNAGTSTTTTTSAAEDKQNGNAGPTAADDQLDLSTLHPAQVYLMMPNNVELEFPKELTEEVPCDSPPTGPVLKILLMWKETRQFYSVSVDNLVEREVNLNTQLKKAYTLKECIDLYTTREQLNEEDSWYCPQCKTHQRAFKKLDLWSLPQILIIHLKRFLYSRYTRDKIETEIEIPVRGMELGDKVLDPSHKQEKYDLIGISNHSGGLGAGHYTARALNGTQWCEFNDSSAYPMGTPMNEKVCSREAYMLVYRRQGTQATRKSQRLAAAAAAAAAGHDSPSASSSSGMASSSAGGTKATNDTGGSSAGRRTSESKMETD